MNLRSTWGEPGVNLGSNCTALPSVVACSTFTRAFDSFGERGFVVGFEAKTGSAVASSSSSSTTSCLSTAV